MKGDYLSGTVSVHAEKSDTESDPTLNKVSKINVKQTSEPIQITMQVDASQLNSSLSQRCVYYDELTNKVRDNGVRTSVNMNTGVTVCLTDHLTDFSFEQFNPAFGADILMDSNLSKIN